MEGWNKGNIQIKEKDFLNLSLLFSKLSENSAQLSKSIKIFTKRFKKCLTIMFPCGKVKTTKTKTTNAEIKRPIEIRASQEGRYGPMDR